MRCRHGDIAIIFFSGEDAATEGQSKNKKYKGSYNTTVSTSGAIGKTLFRVCECVHSSTTTQKHNLI